jgi:hypothetical protein
MLYFVLSDGKSRLPIKLGKVERWLITLKVSLKKPAIVSLSLTDDIKEPDPEDRSPAFPAPEIERKMLDTFPLSDTDTVLRWLFCDFISDRKRCKSRDCDSCAFAKDGRPAKRRRSSSGGGEGSKSPPLAKSSEMISKLGPSPTMSRTMPCAAKADFDRAIAENAPFFCESQSIDGEGAMYMARVSESAPVTKMTRATETITSKAIYVTFNATARELCIVETTTMKMVF